VNPLLDIVRVTESTTGEITVPRRTALLASAWAAEAGSITAVDNTYDQLTIKAHKIVVLTKTSQELLDDAAFNVEAELTQDAGEAFGTGVGKAYIDGAGDASNQPTGLLDTAGVTGTVNTGAAGALTYAGLVDLTTSLKQAYLANSRFLLSVTTLGAIRKLVDSTGQPIWTAMAGSNPANILGYEYTIAEDMPAVAASAKPIVFGDFQSGYRAVRRKEISVKRLNELFAGNDQVGHLFTARFGGKVQDQNALRTQTVSV
jgi:HK97 family phage major capsid protein